MLQAMLQVNVTSHVTDAFYVISHVYMASYKPCCKSMLQAMLQAMLQVNVTSHVADAFYVISHAYVACSG